MSDIQCKIKVILQIIYLYTQLTPHTVIYKASFDKTTKVITACISLLFLGLFISQVILFLRHHYWVFLAAAFLLVLMYFIAYLFSTLSYRVDANDITVHRPASDIHFLRSDIRRIQLVQEENLQGIVRLFGVGGLFGYSGQFSHSQLGCMTWYATRHRDQVVLIELQDNRKIIVTPDEPEQFIAQLSEKM